MKLTKTLFKEFSTDNKKLLALIFGTISLIFFSLWSVPKFWPSAPRWLSWFPRLFGSKIIFRFPSITAAIIAFCVFILLYLRDYIKFRFKTPYCIIMFFINIYLLAALIEITFGRMDNLLEGGIVSIGFISTISLTMLGHNRIVPFAFLGTFIMIFINLIQAENVLVFPGIICFTFALISFILQFEKALEKFQLHFIKNNVKKRK